MEKKDATKLSLLSTFSYSAAKKVLLPMNSVPYWGDLGVMNW